MDDRDSDLARAFPLGRRAVLRGIAVGGVLALTGCGLFHRRASYRFRMTVQADTPQGVKTGSSVYEVNAWYEPGLDPSGKVRKWRVKGEATVVDLPGGQTIFALLKTGAIQNDLASMSMAALDPRFSNDIVESAARIGSRNGTRPRADVARSDWPMLVRFRDANDPKSVEQVDPDAAAVKRIMVETTRDEVTTGIEKRLPWLPEHRGALAYDGQLHPDHPEKDLTPKAFASELPAQG